MQLIFIGTSLPCDISLIDEALHDYTGLILGLRPANERLLYFVMTSLIGWVQT